jgi:hypothetical protein
MVHGEWPRMLMGPWERVAARHSLGAGQDRPHEMNSGYAP